MAVLRSAPKSCEQCEARKVNVFCGLSPEGLEIIDKAKVTNTYRRGQFIFYAGNAPSGLYCVDKGVVKLETTGPTGNNHILRMIRRGGVLGYRAMFSDEPYGASASVHEDAEVCFIPKSVILSLVEKHPKLAIAFLSQVAKELKEAENRFCGLSDKNACERIAESILFLNQSFSDQAWTRKEIGDWAGTTPETVMRTLAEFDSKGLIKQQGRKIMITDKPGLLRLANLEL